MSAQNCGCDPEAQHVCEAHQTQAWRENTWKGGCGGGGKTVSQEVPQQTRIGGPTTGGETVTLGPTRATTLPSDSKERKKYPIATGVLFYFPDAIAAVARVSFEGNEQHNPGQPLHWARGKSTDQEDTLVRHLLQSGTVDTDGQRHSAKAAWRALAILQLEIEADHAKTKA